MKRLNAAAKVIAGLMFSTVFLVACGGGSDDGAGDSADVPLSSAPALVQQYAAGFNAVRTAGANCNGAAMPAVQALTTWNPKLQQAAQLHSNYMAETGVLSHNGRNGSTEQDRARAEGYQGGVSEIALQGRASVSKGLSVWMNSEPHCKMIMAPEFTTVAVAQGGIFTTAMFGF